MRKIKVHVSKEGNTTIETEGFTGQECKDVTKALKAALGATTKVTLTDEYFKHSGTVDRLYTSGSA